MDESKKKNKWMIDALKFLFVVLFICFLTFYATAKDTFLEYQNRQNKVFTEEQIKKFEKDIQAGKEIDIENYLVYEDKIEKHGKKIGLQLSYFIEKYAEKGISGFFKTINKLVD